MRRRPSAGSADEARHLRRRPGRACSTARSSSVLDVPDMRDVLRARRRRRRPASGSPLADARLRAPIVPKKFFHTAGNFREHEEESKRVDWSHEIAPVDRLLPERRRDRRPRRAGRLPRAPDRGARLRARARGRDLRSRGSGSGPRRPPDYIGGYVIFNDITARDIQRREMRSGVFSFCKAIDTFCPLGPVDRHARRDPRPARPRDGAARQRRAAAGRRTRAGCP